MMNNAILAEKQRILLSQQQQQQQILLATVPQSSVVAPQRPFDDIERLGNKNKVASRIFVSEISASPALLGANPEAGLAFVATEFSTKYRPHRSPTGSQRCGDPSRAYILHGKIVWAHNGFPFTVMVKSNGIRGRFYGPNDQRGYFAVPPNTTLNYPEGFDVLRPTQEYSSKLFKDFGHCTDKSYKTGVYKSKGEPYYTIAQGSLIYDILKRNEQNDRAPYDLESAEFLDSIGRDGRKMYRVSSDMYKAARDCFRKKVLTKLPHTDFTKFVVGIERLGCPQWDAPLGTFYYGSTECADETILSQQYRFAIAQWFRYRLVYEGNHD